MHLVLWCKHLHTAIWSRRQVLLRPGRWKRLLKFFSRLFLVDKTFIYENPYEGVWGVLGNSSYKPFYNDLSPLETISNLCFSHFSWKQSKQWTVVGYIYYIIFVTQYIHKQVWWNVFQIMGYAPLYLKSIKCFQCIQYRFLSMFAYSMVFKMEFTMFFVL